MTTATEHATAMGAPADLDACPLMPTYPVPTVQFVRGSGTELWDRDALDLDEEAFVRFGPGQLGELAMIALRADVDYRLGTNDGAPLKFAVTLWMRLGGAIASTSRPRSRRETGRTACHGRSIDSMRSPRRAKEKRRCAPGRNDTAGSKRKNRSAVSS